MYEGNEGQYDEYPNPHNRRRFYPSGPIGSRSSGKDGWKWILGYLIYLVVMFHFTGH